MQDIGTYIEINSGMENLVDISEPQVSKSAHLQNLRTST